MPNDKFLLVRYEDLVNHPDKFMQSVCSFSGLTNKFGLGSGFHHKSVDMQRTDPI